jgi:pimeloyl-ACP methyl ester carboxylesterase
VAIFLAGHDEIVPHRLGQRLHDTYHGPKKVWLSPNATHNTLVDQTAARWKDLVGFWDQHRQ